MKSSSTIKELSAALTKALGAMKNPKLDSNNPFFKSKYASLAGVSDATRPGLAENGIAVLQQLSTVEHGVCCTTRLLHASGEWLETEGFTVPVSKGDAQGTVAASTYARRIDLMAACGVVGDEDDDGNAASGKAPGATPKQAAPKAAPTAPSAPAATADPLIDRFTPKPEYDDATAAIARINACATVADLDALKNKMIVEKPRFSPEEAPMVKEAGAQRREKLLAESAKPLTRDAALASIAGMMTKLGAAKWGSMLRAMDCNPAEKNWHQNLALPAVLALEAQMKEAAK